FEKADLVPGVFRAAEHLVAAVRFEQAHGAGHFFVDRVGGPRDVRHIHEIGEDRGHGEPRLARGPAAPDGGRQVPQQGRGAGGRGRRSGGRLGGSGGKRLRRYGRRRGARV